MSAAKDILDEFGVATDVQVLSAHRTPEAMVEWGKEARANGFSVIIAGAGGAAHLSPRRNRVNRQLDQRGVARGSNVVHLDT